MTQAAILVGAAGRRREDAIEVLERIEAEILENVLDLVVAAQRLLSQLQDVLLDEGGVEDLADVDVDDGFAVFGQVRVDVSGAAGHGRQQDGQKDGGVAHPGTMVRGHRSGSFRGLRSSPDPRVGQSIIITSRAGLGFRPPFRGGSRNLRGSASRR